MASMVTELEDYSSKDCGRCGRFATAQCSTRLWALGLHDLRTICLEAGLQETVKWVHPCYMLAGRNIAIIGAFRRDFRRTLCNAALRTDPRCLLEQPGPNSRHPDMLRFAADDDVRRNADVIRSYLLEAMHYAEEGLRPQVDRSMPDLPDELTDALDAHPVIADAFRALTPGRQTGYVLNLKAAKKPGNTTGAHQPVPRQDHLRQGRDGTLTQPQRDSSHRA